ncbi:TRAP transporter small permease [Bacilliculturomica massiliensis]|uniref:TRAP transporter small permease n=1 Tax=Bacilliculturomica massiliensis TaxID=1917867 RepID=UPI00102F8474|nr:TRAP transporter small permease [Bacilliculturomica massiliensis]
MKVIRFLDDHFEEILMSVALMTIVVFMTLQVFMRYIMHHALSSPEEICRYSFIWMCYLGVSYAVKRGEALRVDILGVIFPKIRGALDVISDAFYVIFCAALLMPGVRVIQSMMRLQSKSAALEIPLWIIYTSLFLGCGLAIFRMIEKYIGVIKKKRSLAAEKRGE